MNKSVPIRKCIACGARKNKMELVRIVNNKGKIIIDPRGNIPGRGAYICPSEQCLKNAQKNNKIEKALKTEIPDEIYNKLTEEIGKQ